MGIPQGGTASPVLFNIYLHELDKYLTTKYDQIMEQENQKRQQYPRDPMSRRYRQLERSAKATKLRIDTIFKKNSISKISELKNYPE